MEYIKFVWRGNERLWVTYWIVGGLGSLIVLAAIYAGTYTFHNIPSMVLFLLLLSLVWGVFCLIAIWRSASKYQGSILWKRLAQIAVILGWLRTAGEAAKTIELIGQI